jgi:hypothetical protein
MSAANLTGQSDTRTAKPAGGTATDDVAQAGLLSGANYLTVLGRLHTFLQPETYLEIGTNTGRSLALAKCASVAVDPRFKVEANVIGEKSRCLFFQMGSDRFFRDYDVAQLLGGPVDFAFLDGLHQYEFLLRDFYNTERACRPNSVIALHDCIPTDIYRARRSMADQEARKAAPQPGAWTGDVWKVLLILKEHRPDLRIYCFDAPPTGLVCITGLDPASTSLRDNYFALVEQYGRLDLKAYGLQRFLGSLDLIGTTVTEQYHDITRLFWM